MIKAGIDEAIYESNKIICRQISRLGQSTRGEVSQEVIESLRHFVEHILLKVYAKGSDIEDTRENIQAAVKFAKSEVKLLHISRFHQFLQVSSSHRALKEQNAERLMLKYYEYLLRIRIFMRDNYSMDVLENLQQFPLEVNDELVASGPRKARRIGGLPALPVEIDFIFFFLGLGVEAIHMSIFFHPCLKNSSIPCHKLIPPIWLPLAPMQKPSTVVRAWPPALKH